MFLKRIFVFFLTISLVIILLSPAFSQIEKVCKFKGVEIPFNLKYKDSLLKKGKYDLELLKQTAQPVYYLQIMKRGKKLCLIPGEQLSYDALELEEIPGKPRMTMKKNSAEKMIHIIIETGTITSIYPLIRIRFKMEYEV
jgi:hypothetical protein